MKKMDLNRMNAPTTNDPSTGAKPLAEALAKREGMSVFQVRSLYVLAACLPEAIRICGEWAVTAPKNEWDIAKNIFAVFFAGVVVLKASSSNSTRPEPK
jgi:hypothetical protein